MYLEKDGKIETLEVPTCDYIKEFIEEINIILTRIFHTDLKDPISKLYQGEKSNSLTIYGKDYLTV
jgi:hypothetical protein